MSEAKDNFKRNFRLGVANGVFFNAALASLSGSTILPAFVSQLTDSKVIIGLLSTMDGFGWAFPQLFVAIFIAHKAKVLGFYNRLAILRLLFFALAISSLIIFSGKPTAILLMFGISFTLLSITAGMAGVAFTEIVGKTIPVNKRGSYFGWRMFLGGIIIVIEGVIASRVLASYPYPYNFGYLYIAGWILMVFGLLTFAYVKEPPVRDLLDKASPSIQLKYAISIFKNDDNFRRLFFSRAAVNTYLLSSPFYIVYAIRNLGAPSNIAGVYLAAQYIGFLLSNILWAWLSNHISNRKVIIFAGTVSAVPPVLAFGSSFIPISPVAFALVFLMLGAADAGISMGYVNYLLEISAEKGRVLSIGVWNTFIAPTLFFSALGGILSQIFSLRILFVIVLLTVAISIMISKRLLEPRLRV
jgi:MFS family permease